MTVALASAPPRPIATSPTNRSSAPGGCPATWVSQLPGCVHRDAVDEAAQHRRYVVDAARGRQVLVVVDDLVGEARPAVHEREREGPGDGDGVRRHEEQAPGEPGGECEALPHADDGEEHRERRSEAHPRLDVPRERGERPHRVEAGVHLPVRERGYDDRRPDQQEREAQPDPGRAVGAGGWHAARLGGWSAPVRWPGRCKGSVTAIRTGCPLRTPSVRHMETEAVCDLVLPCHDEAGALPALLAEVPPGFAVIVVDNGSRDATADVARGHGARVVSEPRLGYGAAVQAGLEAATSEYVAVMDGDGSFDPARAARTPGLGGRGSLRHGARAPPTGLRGGLAVARSGRQRAGRVVAAPVRRVPGARPRSDAGLPSSGRCSTSASAIGVSATRSSCSARRPWPGGGSRSTTSPTGRAPPAPCPRSAAASGVPRAPPTTSGRCSPPRRSRPHEGARGREGAGARAW